MLGEPAKGPAADGPAVGVPAAEHPEQVAEPPEARVGTTDHFFPVQCSASGRSAAPTCRAAEPAAQHRVAPGHQTPARPSAAKPVGSGSTVSDHFLPFQCSAIGSCLVDARVAAPTAQQFSRAEQDTPLKNVSAEPATVGLAFSDHLLPFQCSIKVRVTPDAVWLPTAQQEVTRGQVMIAVARRPSRGSPQPWGT